MELLIKLLIDAIVPFGFVGLIVLFLFLNPEKFEIWTSIIWKAISKIRPFFKRAQRTYVKYDLQGRINDFTKNLHEVAPYLSTQRVEIEWVDPKEVTKSAFLADGRVIIRLRATSDNDENFVRGSYLFVTTCLLHKAKRYISVTQRDAIDLFVSAKLIQKEKPHVISYFLEEYLHPRTAGKNQHLTDLFDAFERFNVAGQFYEVFLQELHYLGDKVFGARKDQNIYKEVNELVEFLDKVANRNIGEEVPLDFSGTYCRFGIVIVGKSFNLTPTGEIWSRFIERHVTPQGMETLYLVGNWEVHDVMDAVANAVSSTYETVRTVKRTVQIYFSGTPSTTENYIIVLRRRGASIFPPSIQKRPN